MPIPTTRRQRLGHTIRKWFGPPEPPEPPTDAGPEEPTGTVDVRSSTENYAIAARGSVFEFRLQFQFIWSADGMTESELTDWAAEFESEARRKVLYLATVVARDLPAHQAREVEIELVKRITEEYWEFTHGDIILYCRPAVRVRLDPKVRDALEPIFRRRVELQAEHENGILRAELVEHLHTRWAEVLDRLSDSPLAVPAARLTEREFADVLRQMIEEQNEVMGQLARRFGDNAGPLVDPSTPDGRLLADLLGGSGGSGGKR